MAKSSPEIIIPVPLSLARLLVATKADVKRPKELKRVRGLARALLNLLIAAELQPDTPVEKKRRAKKR